VRQKSEAGDEQSVPQAVGMYGVAIGVPSHLDFVISVTRNNVFVVVDD